MLAMTDSSPERAERHSGAGDSAERWTRMESVLDTAVDGIVIIDDQGLIDTVNPAAENMFGWKEAELLGRNIKVLMPDPYHTEHDGYLQAYRDTGDKKIIGIGREVVGRRKDGSTFPLQLGVSEFWTGERRWFTGILQDISSRKQLEQEFLQAQKMEAVGRLAGGIAHDFNNLLTGIISGCRVVESLIEEGADATQMLGEIRREARRGASMTRQLLDFSRKRTHELKPVHLNDVVSEAEGMLKNVIGEDVEIDVVLDESEGQIEADSDQLVQILMNLVVNARDAMPGGGRLGIRVECEDLKAPRGPLEPGRYVVLAVSDTGHGMDEATIGKVFEPFFTTKERGKGTGLGLSTVFGMVREFGGFVAVQSEVDRGTTFRLHFPRTDKPAAPAPVSGAKTAPEAGSGCVLVVEDEALVRAGIRHFLTKLGYEVLDTGAPLEALELVQRHSGCIDLLLTDIVMPGMNGPELARRVTAERPSIQVAFMSAFSDRTLVEQGRIESGIPVLEKPFEEEELAERVRTLIQGPPRESRTNDPLRP